MRNSRRVQRIRARRYGAYRRGNKRVFRKRRR